MADTTSVAEPATVLGQSLGRFAADGEAKARARRRLAGAAATAIVHVAIILFLVSSEWLPPVISKPHAVPPMVWLSLPQAGAVPMVNPAKLKKEPRQKVPVTAVPVVRPREPESNAIDLGYALGRSLACGASSFEYLTTEGRTQCRRQPWHYVYDRNGYLVLDAAPRPVEAEKPRPSDVLARQRNTADPCAIAKMSGTECIDKVIFGDHPP